MSITAAIHAPKANPYPKRYCAAIVLFEPEIDLCVANVQALLEASVVPILFDNSETREARSRNQRKFEEHVGNSQVFYLAANGNIGLAAAYNKCIEQAERLENVEAIIFLDQDSKIPLASIRNLLGTYERICSSTSIGVVAGMAMRRDGVPYRVYKDKKVSSQPRDLVPVKTAPSSFSLVPFSAIRTIGRFHSDFFIDHIDVDFCFRCRNAGLLVAVDPMAPFHHEIGLGLVLVMGHAISPISSPFRHYYQIRNILLSAHRCGAPWPAAVLRVLKRFVVIGIVGAAAGRFFERYRFAFLGLRDGLRGRGGSIPEMKK